MPGDGLIPNYPSRLLNSGAGISPDSFLVRVVCLLFSTLELSGEEMKSAMKKYAPVTVSNGRAEISVCRPESLFDQFSESQPLSESVSNEKIGRAHV